MDLIVPCGNRLKLPCRCFRAALRSNKIHKQSPAAITSSWQFETIAARLFVDLIAPKSPSKPSTWQLEAIAAGDVC